MFNKIKISSNYPNIVVIFDFVLSKKNYCFFYFQTNESIWKEIIFFQVFSDINEIKTKSTKSLKYLKSETSGPTIKIFLFFAL